MEGGGDGKLAEAKSHVSKYEISLIIIFYPLSSITVLHINNWSSSLHQPNTFLFHPHDHDHHHHDNDHYRDHQYDHHDSCTSVLWQVEEVAGIMRDNMEKVFFVEMMMTMRGNMERVFFLL